MVSVPFFVALLFVFSGLFVVLFILGSLSSWAGLKQKSLSTATPVPSTTRPLDSNVTANQLEPESPIRGRPDSSNDATNESLWSASRDDDFAPDGLPPQPGETWWPVVGPANALDADRRHCRPDAVIYKSGNIQVASFIDQQIASSFAEQLSEDRSHPWRFMVGDPSSR